MKLATIAFSLCVALGCVRQARAAGPSACAEQTGRSPYVIDAGTDALAALGLSLTFGGISIVRHQQSFVPSCAPSGEGRCDASELTFFDRYAVGKDSDAWRTISDVGEISGLALPFALDALDVWLSSSASPWSDWGGDALVILQAQLAAGTVSNIIKVGLARPRPRQYDPDTYKRVAQREQSFPSGHSVAISVGATAYGATFWYRHPESPMRYAVAAAAAVFTGIGSWARVEAGEHFPSDVLAGAGLGLLSGILIPHVHRRDSSLRVQLMAGPSSLALLGRF